MIHIVTPFFVNHHASPRHAAHRDNRCPRLHVFFRQNGAGVRRQRKDEEAVKFIHENKGVRVGDCKKHCNMSGNRAPYLLKNLIASVAIKAEGNGKVTTYSANGD